VPAKHGYATGDILTDLLGKTEFELGEENNFRRHKGMDYAAKKMFSHYREV
jgi:hypothetical protein